MNKWKVYSNYFGNAWYYRVGRILRANEPFHSGNVEWHGDYMQDKQEAEKIAQELNNNEEK